MSPQKRLKILMADDGSQHAQSAVELIRDLSLLPKSRIMVLRVFTPGQIDALPNLQISLDATRSRLLRTGLMVESELLLGSPAEKIIEIAEERKSDLIVLGAKGLRATLGILLGGVAQQVVEYSPCPTLVVRAPYLGLHRVLLVVDGSLTSQRAARYFVKFPLPDNVDVRVMHVLPPAQQPIGMEPHLDGWRYQQILDKADAVIMERQEKKGKALLERTRKLLLHKGIDATPVLSHGDAATEIIDYAKANKIDLIVAGSRGLSQFKGWWMGSVSRKLVHYSNCSALIVKGLRKE